MGNERLDDSSLFPIVSQIQSFVPYILLRNMRQIDLRSSYVTVIPGSCLYNGSACPCVKAVYYVLSVDFLYRIGGFPSVVYLSDGDLIENLL